ncbi:tail fiber domain-containing protein [Chimaeribacter arupi]|uniref:tail fiber domain-containing protein n=1 Tax=Chimaeribacter arupi TaxID=2060066 RepID=UPI000C7A1407|nr:tail fiber domain-containing protein [Chimaeribacter arupi]PLR52426.1 hypothetical protein CYR52_07665 [Chimaeribacter arupi]
MTVASTQSFIEYTGDGASTTFAVPFYFLQNSDISALIADASGNVQELTYGADYSVTGAREDAGGMATLNNSLAIGSTLLFFRSPPVTQETKYYENGKFPAKSHETALDKLTMLIQDRGWRFDALALTKPNKYARYFDAKDNRISNLGAPVDSDDAATKRYADDQDEENRSFTQSQITAEAEARREADALERDARAEADANIQKQLTGNVPLEASAFSPISWHKQTIDNSVDIPESMNAWSFGPKVTIQEGQVITIPGDSAWTIANGESVHSGDGVSLAELPGADSTGVILQDSVISMAEGKSDIIYVPSGVWRISTPMAMGYKKYYYGPGVLKFDNAEWWRKGGSAGTGVEENYTLFYNYENQSDVTVTFNDIVQPITWIDAYTVSAPASTTYDAVKINIANGTLNLGTVPESVRSYNVLANGGGSISPALPDPVTSPAGMMNTGMGARSLKNITTGENNTAYGGRSLMTLTSAVNQTAIGFQALYRSSGNGNTAVGSIAGEWLTSGEYNSLFGLSAGAKLKTGGYNVAAGYGALGESPSCSYTVAIGHRALGNSGDNEPSYVTSIGTFAGDFAYGSNNTWVGYRAGCGAALSDGLENVAVGYQAMRNQSGADYNVSVGVISLQSLTSGQYNVAIGHSALNILTTASSNTAVGYKSLSASTAASLTAVGFQSQMANTTGTGNTSLGNNTLKANQTGIDNTAVGESVMLVATGSNSTAVGARSLNAQTTGSNNTAMGYEAGRFTTTSANNVSVGFRAGRALTTGGENTAVGADALQLETTGTQNTALGRLAMRVLQDGTTPVAITNSTGIGYGAYVSGSNQVQIGNSATTTYVYGTVQNRSDSRDKADVEDIDLGIDFINGLRPVSGRWNMRDDYYTFTEVETGETDKEGNPVTKTEVSFDEEGYKAETKKRKRLHQWFIYQEVEELIQSLGLNPDDYGFLQNAKVNGGVDVGSLGYDEFIPPVVKAIQSCWSRIDELEKRISNLESK